MILIGGKCINMGPIRSKMYMQKTQEVEKGPLVEDKYRAKMCNMTHTFSPQGSDSEWLLLYWIKEEGRAH